MSEKIITIFGSGKIKPGDGAYDDAYETGRLLAQAGFTIANGGYAGTMEAGAKGAVEAGGEAIGITCSAFGRGDPNEYITREIVTDSLQRRLDMLIELGSAYIVLPGGTGTLLELAEVWELKNKGFLNQKKPIIIVGDFWSPLLELIAAVEAETSRHIHRADTPASAIEVLSAILESNKDGS